MDTVVEPTGLWIVALLGLCLAAALAFYPRWQARRRKTLASRPFPSAWRGILRRRVPMVARLPENRQAQLRQRMLVFLAEVPIIGCAGLHVRDDMRVVIAAQACLLMLGRPEPMFPGLRQVLLYPGSFVVERDHRDEVGVVHRSREVHAGESWSEGQVVLSWEDSRHGAAVPDDGFNVVLHEFAHHMRHQGLRILSGPPGAGDAPSPLAGTSAQARWDAVMNQAFSRYCQRINVLEASGQSLEDECLDPYAATGPEEFFAVATEAFFETPQALLESEPAVYGALKTCWGVDPAAWLA